MAYMRGDPYVYNSGRGLEIYSGREHVVLPHERAEELAWLQVARWDADKLDEVMRRTEERGLGSARTDRVIAALREALMTGGE